MFELVIPARNEADRLDDIVGRTLSAVPNSRVVVVDNASSDGTAEVARRAGASVVVSEPQVGKGYAVAAGLRLCVGAWAFVCDGDILGLDPAAMVTLLRTASTAGNCRVARLGLGRPPEAAPVSTLLAQPLLAALGLGEIQEPLGGLLAVDCRYVLSNHLPGGWGFDVALTIQAAMDGVLGPEQQVRGVSHRVKPLAAYAEMAREVAAAALSAMGLLSWDHRNCLIPDCGGRRNLSAVKGHALARVDGARLVDRQVLGPLDSAVGEEARAAGVLRQQDGEWTN